ncbi:hypothetical protein DFH11DRAFT_1461063, partial [Phellopilus nigrolimitatus]
KENSARPAQEKLPSIRRSSKNSRIYDRWPVLNRIIRTNKATPRADPSVAHSSDSDSSSDSEDEDAVAIHSSNNRASFPQYRPRLVHSTSPKFPSPLTGVRPVRRQTAARHGYMHHGHSQSAFYHLRELWRKRRHEWEEYEYMLWQAGVTLEEAYGGIIEDGGGQQRSLPSHIINGPWRRLQPVVTQEMSETNLPQTPLNPAIFPRLGDLSSLRDSFLISVDTWFSDFPLWTLSKLVWIYDINHRSLAGSAPCRRRQRCLSNNFLEDFDASNSSADTLVSTSTNTSDTTLVNANSASQKSDDITLMTPNILEKKSSGHAILQSSSVTSNISMVTQARSWETCWFSRWEILYHEVSLAADIAASSGNSDSSANGSKEAARIILTTPTVLYDPHAFIDGSGSSNNEKETAMEDAPMTAPEMETRVIVPMEEDEDDYGEVVTESESRYRLGAHVNPLSMFATATTEDVDELSSSKYGPLTGESD